MDTLRELSDRLRLDVTHKLDNITLSQTEAMIVCWLAVCKYGWSVWRQTGANGDSYVALCGDGEEVGKGSTPEAAVLAALQKTS